MGVPEAAPLEDWWLVRDASGHTGWLLASRLDVDVPDEIGLYAEGQRIVGSWVLTKVTDPDANTPNHEEPEFLTVMAPPKAGLPFDFDQVRVFTWSLKHHRYETAFRLRPIQGFLPVKVIPGDGATPGTFSFQIPANGAIATDKTNGISRPVQPRTIGFRLVDTRVERIGPDLGPIPVQRDASAPQEGKKDKNGKKSGRRR